MCVGCVNSVASGGKQERNSIQNPSVVSPGLPGESMRCVRNPLGLPAYSAVGAAPAPRDDGWSNRPRPWHGSSHISGHEVVRHKINDSLMDLNLATVSGVDVYFFWFFHEKSL